MTAVDVAIPPCRQARDAAARFAGATALVDGRRRWSFAAAWAEAEALASGLIGLGLTPGDRIALWMENCAELVLLSWAAEIAGLVRVPLNARYTAAEVERILADCTPALVVADAGRAVAAAPCLALGGPEWARLPAATPAAGLYGAGPGDLCSLNYTSGSTGAPKGVMLSHRNWAEVYRNLLTDRDIRGDDRLAHAGPLSHASGAYVLPFFLAGATSVICPARGGVEGLLATIQAERCTVLTCVPTLLTRLLGHPRVGEFDLSSLRHIGYGAEPIPLHTLQAAIARFGPILSQNYGLTEAMMTCCHLRADEHIGADGRLRHGALGRPYSHVEIVLRDAAGQPVPDGAVGEITVRSGHVMQGYWRQPQETARVLRDGWLWTGDLARRDAGGLLWLAGRAKDMLISGGFNIYPQEVEAELSAAPGVREVAVVGVPDPDWGELAVAFVAGDGLCVEALRDWSRPRLGLRTPRRWHIVESLPRTAVGKVDKARLKSALASAKMPAGDAAE